MMKPPKERIKSSVEKNIDDLLPQACKFDPDLVEEVPSYYKYKLEVVDLIEHEFLPKLPTELQHLTGDAKLKWQVVELMMRVEFCNWLNIPSQLANKLVKIDNSYGIESTIAAGILRQSNPAAKFQVLYSDETKCVMQGRLEPNHAWTPHTFDIVDAQTLHLLDKKNQHWEGPHGKQKMLAKNCWMELVHIIARHIFGGVFFADQSVDYQEGNIIDAEMLMEQNGKPVSFDSIEKTSQQQEENASTQIVKFSPSIDLDEEPEPVMDTIDVLDVEPAPLPKMTVTQEDIDQARTQKLSELPPPKGTEPEIMDDIDPSEYGFQEEAELAKAEVQALIQEEPTNTQPEDIIRELNQVQSDLFEQANEAIKNMKKKKITSKKSIKDVVEKKPDTTFLDKTPLKETTVEELRKPFPMTQLTLDAKYHTKENYDLIGDDWFRSFTIKESKEIIGIDMNIVAYENVLGKNLFEKIKVEYDRLLKDANDSEKLVVLFHDAMFMIENPPDLSKIDAQYFDLMQNTAKAMYKVAEVIRGTNPKPENPMDFIIQASKGKWTNKEAVWGYKYMEARGLL